MSQEKHELFWQGGGGEEEGEEPEGEWRAIQ